MSGFKLSPEAFRDIEEIWEFIAEDNLDAADRVREKIFTACEKIAELPGMGHLRKDLADEALRFWPVYSYLIIYRPDVEPLEIVRVLHGARDVERLL
jgi:antitoxin ParD1/3/4/toxin ParE1/3/4